MPPHGAGSCGGWRQVADRDSWKGASSQEARWRGRPVGCSERSGRLRTHSYRGALEGSPNVISRFRERRGIFPQPAHAPKEVALHDQLGGLACREPTTVKAAELLGSATVSSRDSGKVSCRRAAPACSLPRKSSSTRLERVPHCIPVPKASEAERGPCVIARASDRRGTVRSKTIKQRVGTVLSDGGQASAPPSPLALSPCAHQV